MRFVTPLSLAVLVGFVLITLAGLVVVPPDLSLPVRWSLDGSVTAAMPSRLALLQLPIGVAVIWAAFYALGRWGNPDRRASSTTTLRWGLPVLTALFALMQLVIVLIGLGIPVPFFDAA